MLYHSPNIMIHKVDSTDISDVSGAFTFSSKIGGPHVTELGDERPSLHSRGGQIPGVGVRLISVRHQAIVYVQGVGVDQHSHHTEWEGVDRLCGG